MSVTKITIERVNEVEHHPDADKLDIVQVLGFRVVCGRDQFHVGDAAIFFPPDIIISPQAAEELKVTKYLKSTIYPGDIYKTQCRVSSCRLRGVPSHGFVIGPIDHTGPFGTDLTSVYGGHKYEPPVRQGAGDAMRESAIFHRYTNIENIQRYPNAIPDGTTVRITEKLHGSNCRIGKCREEDEWEYMAGSHKVRRKQGTGLYWEPFKWVKPLLDDLCGDVNDVVVFGEIFGPGVQDLDYGQAERSFRVFDISVNGIYLDWGDVYIACDKHSVPTVPLLYTGPFSLEGVERLTYGPTTFGDVKCSFKGREGCVVTPLQEQFSKQLRGRMIVKSVSADYRDRKNAVDIE
jgi:RNA ligase (TIGR02306 family)